MARALTAWLAAIVLIAACTCASAQTWTKVGDLGFSANTSLMQDYKRIRFNAIAFDGEGNIYASACTGTNGGNVSIFQPDGTPIANVNLDALGYPGQITKMVTGGDGVVYALQNWLEINWSYAGNVNRIIAIGPEGDVVPIWNAGVMSDANRITGMTVGPDGNIYWTMNGADNYWKYHYFWRCIVGTSNVEEWPKKGTNYGWSESSRMLCLESVGAAADTYSFAVIKSSGSTAWRIDKLSWTLGRDQNPSEANPGWGRDHITATAYDPINKIVWAGGRGAGNGPWALPEGRVTFSNGEIVMTEQGGLSYYELTLPETNPDPVTSVSIASRFCVAEISGTDYNSTMLHVQAIGNEPLARIVASNGNFALSDSSSVLQILGPIVQGEYHTAYLVVNQSNDSIQCWWDGDKVYDGPAALETYYPWSRAFFGESVRDGVYAGSATVAFDWVAVDNRPLTPGDPMPTELAYYLDGAQDPGAYRSTNILTCFGGAGSSSYFPYGWSYSWHANDNNPDVSRASNGGRYWISAIACDPTNGDAWMSWNGESNYNHDPIGAVWSRYASGGEVMGLGFEGVPQANSQTVALGFNNGLAYALVCDMATGLYSVYSRQPGATAMTVAAAKQQQVGTFVATDSPKLVTYPDTEDYGPLFFYIEEEDQSGAIRVVPDLDQPMARVGDRVMVEGRTGVVDGEAVIFASSVVISSAGEDRISPLGMTVRSVGGSQQGIQPPTLSGGSAEFGFPLQLNTTGLLIRVTGKIQNGCVDDGSAYPLRIEYPYVPGQDGDLITVTGISGVAWDGATGFRVIIPRSESDMDVTSAAQ